MPGFLKARGIGVLFHRLPGVREHWCCDHALHHQAGPRARHRYFDRGSLKRRCVRRCLPRRTFQDELLVDGNRTPLITRFAAPGADATQLQQSVACCGCPLWAEPGVERMLDETLCFWRCPGCTAGRFGLEQTDAAVSQRRVRGVGFASDSK
jgi:hypothetical protein